MKKPSFRQFLAIAVLGLVLTVAGAAWLLGTRWGQRHLEQLIRERLARNSTLVLAPLEVEISALRHFPHITVSLRHVLLTDTSFRRAVPVLRIGQADARLELGHIWRGEFRVSHLTLRDAEFRQLTDSLGHDWGLRGKGPRRHTPSVPPNLDVDSLVLVNVSVQDRNELHNSGFHARVQHGRLVVQVRKGLATTTGLLDGQLDYLRSGRGNLFDKEPVVAHIRYRYDFRRREGTFLRTRATLNGDTVLVNGTHRGAAPNESRGTRLNLRFEGRQPLLEVLHVALPSSLDHFLDDARSPSRAHIWYSIRGVSGPTTRPRTVLRFALRNAQVQWADSARRIRRWDARGVFDNGPSHSPRTTSLSFEQCRIYSNAGELDAKLTVSDFTKPHLQGHVRGRTELQTLASVVVPKLWRARHGQATIDLKLDGTLPEIPDRATRRALRAETLLPPIAARGTVQLENASFSIPDRQANMVNLNVRVRLRDSLWTLENLSGQLNGMRVRANATTTYLLAYFSGQHPVTTVVGTFAVDELHLKELSRLLAAPQGRSRPPARTPRLGRTPNQELATKALNLLPPGLRLSIRLRCGLLVLASDTLEQLAATVRHNGRTVQLRDLHMRVWGGQVSGVVGWPTDTLDLQPVAAQLAVRFASLNYQQLLTRLTRPSRRAPGAAKDPTLREVLLAANGQANVLVSKLVLPAGNNLTNVRVRIDKNGPSFQVPALTFRSSSGGTGRLSASAQLSGTHLTQARADLDLRYSTLDVQHLLQLLASLSTVPPPAPASTSRRTARPSGSSPFLDGTITGRVNVVADQIRYGALRGQAFRLVSSLEAGAARVEHCSLRAFGGDISLRGVLQTYTEGAYHPLHAQLRLHRIQLPELFGLATTLGLDVLGSENIRGTMNGETDLHTQLDNTFLPNLMQTRAFLKTDLHELELLNVEALMEALRFMRQERTSRLYFEPVSPRFILDGGRLLIPDLQLNSNLTDMSVSGEYYLNGQANLYVGLSPLQALFGNNEKRIERIRSGEAAQRRSRGLVYLNLSRAPRSRYKVRPFQKREQRLNRQAMQQEFQELLRTQKLDTTLRLLQ
ncbi:AsmA-like C-terminal region-containing protein [Hymenobacter psychrotolerans]|uniref:AsmA-like C-terminal region n=1 Tax=Hymenobacter psychrotolerans DSM 18569 TaxID=1121959 RepID=A0A1M6V5H3_9BACT|nr:AsmA-like C-terminal region-containing protein [Hymenobacter psychrotolerans]SHK76644.1 AsmA-like C-terminal region [Hymenobacter psychrotolerans DSM 18569]